MNFLEEIQTIRAMVQSPNKDRIASNHYFLSDESVLAYPRGDGVTRQPYVYDGRMLWAYSCGARAAAMSRMASAPSILAS